jgi:opacity protein-like surface antigen
MRRTALITAIAATFAAAPIASQAIQLTDYSFPDSEWEEAYVEARGSIQSGNQDQTSYDLYLNGDYEYNFTSLPRNMRFYVDGLFDYRRGSNDNDDTEKYYEANATGTVDTYFNENDKLFWYGAGDLGYREDADDMYIQVGAGLGYGRVINATPLAYALRVVEELRQHGVVSANVSDATLLKMAQVIDRENEFKSKYGLDEYEPYWYKEIEAVLNAAGALTNKALGAEGVLHMQRVLEDEPITTRKHGWLVRGGVGYVLQNYNGEDSDPAINAQAEYALPIGLQSQFINLFTYSTIFADDTDQNIMNRMSYTYEFSDEIDWENTWNLTYLVPGDSDMDNVYTNILSSSLRYYLTNRLTAGLTVMATYVEDEVDDNGNDDWDFGTFFDLRYRLK